MAHTQMWTVSFLLAQLLTCEQLVARSGWFLVVAWKAWNHNFWLLLHWTVKLSSNLFCFYEPTICSQNFLSPCGFSLLHKINPPPFFFTCILIQPIYHIETFQIVSRKKLKFLGTKFLDLLSYSCDIWHLMSYSILSCKNQK